MADTHRSSSVLKEEQGPLALWEDIQAGLLRRFPQRYWQGIVGQRRAEAICREFFRRRGIATAEQAAQLTQADFEAVQLRGMLAQVYCESPYHALKPLFPSLEPWQMARAPRDMWQGPDGCSHALRALRWLLREERCAGGRLSLACITAAGLRGMLKYVFGDRLTSPLAPSQPANVRPHHAMRCVQRNASHQRRRSNSRHRSGFDPVS